MSKLEELIQKLCPDGVEYYELGNIGKISMCKRILKAQTNTKEGVPFYKIGTFGGVANAYISNDLFQEYKEKYSYPKKGDILLSAAGTIGRTVVFDGKPSYFQDSNIVWLANDESKVCNQFLCYFYETKPWKVSDGSTIKRLYNDNIAKTKIPVPPMEVQQEIVRLLDDFTAKTAELQAELNKEYEARKKQYEYYKEVLLCNNENVDKVKIKDIVCKINKIKWNQTENTYQYIDLSSVDRETHTLLNTSIIDRNNAPSRAQQIVCVDDVLFGTTRPMLKRLCVIPDEYDGQICSTGFCVLRAIDNIVQPKWIYHVLNTTQFYSYVESHQQGTSYPSISDSLVKEYEITLPSLDEQIRIINILDNLEETNFELNNNLSLELESRQKQYEFYRDKLLTFKELK